MTRTKATSSGSRPKTETTSTTEAAAASTIALALGANVGARERTLRRAVATIRNAFGPLRVASLYDGPAVDPSSGTVIDAPHHLNTALLATGPSGWTPAAIVSWLKALELAAGRQRGRWYGSRPLDIDLLWADDLRRDDPWLTLPHPGLYRRRFVLAPLAEIDPDLPLPPAGTPAARALADLPPTAPPVVRRSWRRRL